MYFNSLSRCQRKYVQYLLHIRHLQLLRMACNMNEICSAIKPVLPLCCDVPHSKRVYFYAIRKYCKEPGQNIQPILNDDGDVALCCNSLMSKINTTDGAEKLLDFIEQNKEHLEINHYVQCLTLIWSFYQHGESMLKQTLSERLQHQFLPALKNHLSKMDANDSSCCYLYLRKMKVPNRDHILEHILIKALNSVESGANNIDEELMPLTALSRLSVGINIDRDFYTPLVCQNFIPHLERHVSDCYTEQQARLLATCFFHLNPLINEEILGAYKQRISEMLLSGVLSNSTPKTLLKVLHMLNLPIWSYRHTLLIRDIMLHLCQCIPQLEVPELKTLCRIFLHYQEPAALAQPLKAATESLLQLECSPDALACAVPFASPQQREEYVKIFELLLHSKAAWLAPNASGHFFSVLRSLKVADNKFCDVYWSNVVLELESNIEEQTHLRFLRHSIRYMNFNNNLGGTYRHFKVERKLAQMCMHAIEYDLAGRLPAKFVRLAAFVLAYGHTPFAWKKFPNVIISKIISMAPQFGIADCFLLSRGIQIASELRFRHDIPSTLSMQLSTIDSVLIACAERHLAIGNEQTLDASELSVIVRTLSHRKSLKNTMAYNQALSFYKTLHSNDLNSRVIRDMAYNFNTSNFIVPQLLDSMFEYVAQNNDHVTGDTVEKVLTCAYNLGYTPDNRNVLDIAGLVLLRDFESMNSLALIQGCLALCFYKVIPEQLVNQVFCVKFIQRIEDEIQICYSKATYPARVLNLVMQLNRTVCLDLPEANVPWFQQNYVEAQLSKKRFMPNNFSKDVQHLLKELLKGENFFRCNHTTPYGYQIDFVIHFDRDKKPIRPQALEVTMLNRITKIAILLLKLDSYCENDLSALRGPELLKIKHLEMMGYKVLHINEHDWNSKYMLAAGAKSNYLKCLLQIAH